MDVRTDDGCRLWVERTGVGPPLVFCHGGPGLWDYFEPVVAQLGDVATCVRWDQRGCGRSQRRGPYTVARSVADLDAVRQTLDEDRIDLLGHSWGAMLALRYALAHPDRVRRLVYVSGTGVDPGETWRPAFARAFAQRIGADGPRWRELLDRDPRTPTEDREYAVLQWSTDFVDPTTAHQHARELGWLGIGWECATAINAEMRRYLDQTDVLTLCRGLRTPTLIVDGDHDLRPRAAVDSLEQALPDVRRVHLADAGHIPWVEDPDGFRRAVAGFLTDHTTSNIST
ncbi:alpha/beta hydrolase [Asanoa sp. WMMD1127]|uniref:alpha/beta fold hydrolase n=1 Tax=Asanoa sp. WMMD1127 TaxID=3016107 RepID=UPI002416415A|nr:alpha/beta hydrolase [Asanoa sp. WMMD1127]MDG4824654.1 alpha/beta hydrolase [Asanoa sp. WMMD1127]